MSGVRIERLGPDAAEPYRTLMLQAYAAHPDAFTATVAERAALPIDFWLQRLDPRPDAADCTIGAWLEGHLIGAVTLECLRRPKTRHKAHLLGMYVAPQARGQGAGRRLVQAALAAARARAGLRLVTLTVTEGNEGAEALYRACGFARFGVEPLAMQSEDGAQHFNKVHMACLL